MARWLECPVCHGVFAFLREGFNPEMFAPIRADDYTGWDGLFFERHTDIRCIDCGRSAREVYDLSHHAVFTTLNLRAGNQPNPRAMLTVTGHRGEEEAMGILATALSTDSYCTLNEKRKLIVPRLREMSDD